MKLNEITFILKIIFFAAASIGRSVSFYWWWRLWFLWLCGANPYFISIQQRLSLLDNGGKFFWKFMKYRMQFFLSIRFFLFNQSIFGPEIMCKIEFSKLDSYHIHTKQKQNRAGIKTFNNISIFIIEIHFVQKFGIDIIPFPKAANLHMQNF